MESLRPPPGGDVNRGTTFIVMAAVFASLSLATTTIRITVRSIKHQLGWDDYTIAVATFLLLLELVFNGLQYHTGSGRHAYYLSGLQRRESLKWVYITQVFLFLIVCTTKVSICLFILRIKKTGWLRWCLYALMVGLVSATIPCIVILFAQCRPVRAYWDRSAGVCWDPKIYADAIWAQVGRFGYSKTEANAHTH